jgi:hypothetical protein
VAAIPARELLRDPRRFVPAPAPGGALVPGWSPAETPPASLAAWSLVRHAVVHRAPRSIGRRYSFSADAGRRVELSCWVDTESAAGAAEGLLRVLARNPRGRPIEIVTVSPPVGEAWFRLQGLDVDAAMFVRRNVAVMLTDNGSASTAILPIAQQIDAQLVAAAGPSSLIGHPRMPAIQRFEGSPPAIVAGGQTVLRIELTPGVGPVELAFYEERGVVNRDPANPDAYSYQAPREPGVVHIELLAWNVVNLATTARARVTLTGAAAPVPIDPAQGPLGV